MVLLKKELLLALESVDKIKRYRLSLFNPDKTSEKPAISNANKVILILIFSADNLLNINWNSNLELMIILEIKSNTIIIDILIFFFGLKALTLNISFNKVLSLIYDL